MSAAERADASVAMYYADYSATDAAAVEALITDRDRERLSVLSRPQRRTEYLAGRALLRFALERWTGKRAASHELRSRTDGKPECVGGPAISVSHSGSLVACAIAARGEVGIDVQCPQARYHTAAIARRYFNAEENEWLYGAPAERFYMLWVLKEAYAKASGCGLLAALDQLRCRIDPPRIHCDAPIGVELALYRIGSAFVGIATTAHAPLPVHARRWNGENARRAAPEPTLIAHTG